MEENEEEEVVEKNTTKAKKIVGKRIVLSLENYKPIKEEIPLVEVELIPESELGEWEAVFNRLKPEVQEKMRKYPVTKQIEVLKKMQAPKTKIVTAK